jgi:addiction module RelB/DinJ family antitoxin
VNKGDISVAAINYTFRIDETDRQAVEDVFNRLGLTLAAGLNVYIKAVARQQRIPFDLTLHDNTSASGTGKSKEKSLKALTGILSGHDIDLDMERKERILDE